MKRRIMSVVLVAFAAVLTFALAGCQSEPYEPEALSPKISSPAIVQDGVLKVGVDTTSSPFAGQVNGKIVGLDVDTAAALADQLGLKLELVDISASGVSALEDGSVDIVLGLTSADADDSLWLSDPYIQTAVALFSSPGNTTVPTAASAPTIAAQTSSMSAWAVENIFGEASLVPCEDLKSAFSSVETGSAAYVAADAVIGSYAAKMNNVDVQIIALLENAGGYCIGVSADNTDLQSAIADALGTVQSGGILDIVDMKWLGSEMDLSSMPLVEGATASVAENAEGVESDGMTTGAASAGANAVTPDGGVAGA